MRSVLGLVFVSVAVGCGARSGLDAPGASSGAGGSGTSGIGGGGSAGTGAGGGAPRTLCPDDPCTADGCGPVLLFPFDPFTEGELGVEAPRVCVSHNPDGNTTYDCFDRCGGPPFMTATDSGYSSGMLLEGGALTSAVGVSSPDPFVHVVRRDLTAPNPAAATTLFSSTIPFTLDNLVRAGDALYFSWTTSDWLDKQGIYRMPHEGGSPARLSPWRVEPAQHPMVLAADALILSSDAPPHYGLASLDVAAGQPPTLLRKEHRLVVGLAVTQERIVWIDVELGPVKKKSWIRSMALDGTGEDLLGELDVAALDVVADPRAVYIVTEKSIAMTLSFLPVAGGPLKPVVTDPMRVDRLTQDADYLYYVGHDGVYRVRKPAL